MNNFSFYVTTVLFLTGILISNELPARSQLTHLTPKIDHSDPTFVFSCPDSSDFIAIVVGVQSGEGGSFFCKLKTGETYYKYVDCREKAIAKDMLVVVHRSYTEMWDNRGNIKCMQSHELIQILGKVIADK